MKITEALSTEHLVFHTQLNQLEASLGKASPEAVRAMVQLIGVPLEEHAHREEELLFPALEPFLGRQVGPLAVMDAEHNELRSLLGRIASGQTAPEPLARQFIETLRAHADKEDQVLFQMAERFLGAAKLEELGAASPIPNH